MLIFDSWIKNVIKDKTKQKQKRAIIAGLTSC
jgi:hypothetical protein